MGAERGPTKLWTCSTSGKSTFAAIPRPDGRGYRAADPAGWNLAANSGNVGQDAQNSAQAGYLNTLGQTPQNVQAGQLSNTNLQPYMNPYTQSVINSTLPIMQQNLALQQNQNQDQAAASNAFGGSRQAIQQGVTQAQGAQNMAQMAAQLNQANFGQAQAGAQGDIANTLKAQQGNQSAALQQGATRQPGIGRPRHARQSADAEQHRQFRHVDLGRRLRAAARRRTTSMRNWPSSIRPSNIRSSNWA